MMKYNFNISIFSKIIALLMAISIVLSFVACTKIIKTMPDTPPSPGNYQDWINSNNLASGDSNTSVTNQEFSSPNPPEKVTAAAGVNKNTDTKAEVISNPKYDGPIISPPAKDQLSLIYNLKPVLESLPELTNDEQYYNFGTQQLSAGNAFEGYMALAHIGNYKDAPNLIRNLSIKNVVLSRGLKPTILVLMSNNELYAWGANSFGQLGMNNTDSPSRAKKIATDVAMADAGNGHLLVLKLNGDLYSSGQNSDGQLGDGTYVDRSAPYKVMSNIKYVAAGLYHSLAIDNDGKLFTWGTNFNGQLGNGLTNNALKPVNIMNGVKKVFAGYEHSAAIDDNDILYTWGSNVDGQLGTGRSGGKKLQPVRVFDGVKYASLGNIHTAIIALDNRMYMCGGDDNYQLGYPYYGSSDKIQAFFSKANWARANEEVLDVSAGTFNTVVLLKTGEMYSAGINAVATSTIFYKTFAGAQKVWTEHGNNIALMNNGTLYTWGKNTSGQLGCGNDVYRPTPAFIFDVSACNPNARAFDVDMPGG